MNSSCRICLYVNCVLQYSSWAVKVMVSCSLPSCTLTYWSTCLSFHCAALLDRCDIHCTLVLSFIMYAQFSLYESYFRYLYITLYCYYVMIVLRMDDAVSSWNSSNITTTSWFIRCSWYQNMMGSSALGKLPSSWFVDSGLDMCSFCDLPACSSIFIAFDQLIYVKKLTSLKFIVRTMWWYHSTNTAKIFLGNPRWGYAWGVHKLPHE